MGSNSVAKPLLKWAGGKRLLIPTVAELVADNLKPGHRYIEPFVGGGAIAFHLGLPNMILNDYLPELVNLYRSVRDEPARVAWALSALACRGVDETAYYSVRDERPTDPIMQAARMVYLNKLCYSGLYRVNKKGEFNVPYAKDKYRESMVKRKSRDAITSLFPHKGKFEAASEALLTSTIYCGDFESVVDLARDGDVVYCDPPYHNTFTSYTSVGFSAFDQVRLASALFRAKERGVYVITSNSDTPLIREAYYWANVTLTEEKRNFGGRKRAPCVLITA